MLYEAWIISDRNESPHRLRHDPQTHPGHAPLLSWFPEIRAWTMYLISGVVVQGWWYICMDMLFYCFMSVLCSMVFIWQGWITSQTTAWPPITPRTCSAVTLSFGKESLNNVPHQRCSDRTKIINLFICYPTVLWVLYEDCITCDRGESPHRPQHDLQLHPGHAQLLPWFS